MSIVTMCTKCNQILHGGSYEEYAFHGLYEKKGGPKGKCTYYLGWAE